MPLWRFSRLAVYPAAVTASARRLARSHALAGSLCVEKTSSSTTPTLLAQSAPADLTDALRHGGDLFAADTVGPVPRAPGFADDELPDDWPCRPWDDEVR